jgi:hypothetical protein
VQQRCRVGVVAEKQECCAATLCISGDSRGLFAKASMVARIHRRAKCPRSRTEPFRAFAVASRADTGRERQR